MSEVGPVTRAEVAEQKVGLLSEGVVLMQDMLHQVEQERDHYKAALERIAGQSPRLTDDWLHWRTIAREALDGDQC